MTVANDALLIACGQNQFPVYDGLVGVAVATQNAATRLTGNVNRVTKSVNTGSFVLPQMLTGEADSSMVFVINDSANTINIYPFVGETMQGSANATFQITTGTSGFFLRVYGASIGKGGGNQTPTNDWRPASIP
jgi:hypothetical protein